MEKGIRAGRASRRAGSARRRRAARVGGIVVAKDAKRQAVVLASTGSVRTVRAGRAFTRLRDGQRVAANASRRADGTYQASSLRATGRAGSVRFGAVDGPVSVSRPDGSLFSCNAPADFALSLTERSETALTVRSADGTDSTCDVPPGLDLSAFPVGTQVKLHCHRLDGKFRLGLIKSEQAVVEVPH